ncbi:hypothetical protein ACWD6I_28665, partial [Streptomyces sp. NPDC002454]
MPAISPRLTGRTEASDRRGPEVQYLEIFAVTLATHHMLVAEGVEPVAVRCAPRPARRSWSA